MKNLPNKSAYRLPHPSRRLCRRQVSKRWATIQQIEFCMKTNLLVLAFAICTSAMVAGPTSVLLIDPTGTTRTQAVIGDISVTADSITFDSPATQLRCTGRVELRRDGIVVKTGECEVDLPSGSTVYRFNPQGVEVKPNKALDRPAPSFTPPVAEEPRH